MGFWQKKKEEKTVQPTVQNEMSEVQQTMSEERANLEKINSVFEELNSSTFYAKIQKQATSNEQLMVQKDSDFEKSITETAKKGLSTYSLERRREWQKDLYYNNVWLNDFIKRMSYICELYKRSSSAEKIKNDADIIDKYICKYLYQLKAALVAGYKLKANACMDVLKYAVIVGQQPILEDKEKVEIIRNEREKVIRDDFGDLLQSVDKLYGSIFQLERMEKKYIETMESYKIINARLTNVPQEILQTFETMGFKRANESLPANHPARKYLGDELAASEAVAMLKSTDVLITTLTSTIVALNAQIAELNDAIKDSYDESSKLYDSIKVERTIQRIRDEKLRNIEQQQNMIVNRFNANEEFASLIDDAARNEGVWKAFDNSLQSRKEFNAILEKQAALEEETAAIMKAAELNQENEQQENEQQPLLNEM